MTRRIEHYDRDLGDTGIIAPKRYPHDTSSVTALTANRAYFAPVVPSHDTAITSIVYNVVTQDAANPNVDVGLYDSAFTRLVSAGATAGKLNTTGNQSVTIASTVLTRGTLYYAALSSASAVPVLWMATWPSTGASGLLGIGHAWLFAASHPLPAGPVAASKTTAVPILGLL